MKFTKYLRIPFFIEYLAASERGIDPTHDCSFEFNSSHLKLHVTFKKSQSQEERILIITRRKDSIDVETQSAWLWSLMEISSVLHLAYLKGPLSGTR